jgi:hypothetical protein
MLFIHVPYFNCQVCTRWCNVKVTFSIPLNISNWILVANHTSELISFIHILLHAIFIYYPHFDCLVAWSWCKYIVEIRSKLQVLYTSGMSQYQRVILFMEIVNFLSIVGCNHDLPFSWVISYLPRKSNEVAIRRNWSPIQSNLFLILNSIIVVCILSRLHKDIIRIQKRTVTWIEAASRSNFRLFIQWWLHIGRILSLRITFPFLWIRHWKYSSVLTVTISRLFFVIVIHLVIFITRHYYIFNI